MKKANVRTWVYEDGAWIITIYCYREETFEAWLMHENYGTQMLIFGASATGTCCTLAGFKHLVEHQLADSKEIYQSRFLS